MTKGDPYWPMIEKAVLEVYPSLRSDEPVMQRHNVQTYMSAAGFAQNEIARLRTENAKLRAALSNFVDWFDEATHPDSTGEVYADEMADEVLRLRAALAPAADETGGGDA